MKQTHEALLAWKNPLGLGFVATCLALAIFKLWLVADFEVFARNAPNDALWFARMASNLVNGQWLGEFDEKMTLLRQPGFPIWIALVHAFKIPLRLAADWLLIFSGFVFAASLVKADTPKWLCLALFTLLVFQPLSFSFNSEMECETFYTPMLLLSLSCMTMTFLTPRSWRLWAYSFGTGLTLAFLWNTREENLLIFFYFALFAFLLWRHARAAGGANKIEWKKLAIAVLLPALMVSLSVLLIAAKNFQKYGIFATTKASSKTFTKQIAGYFEGRYRHRQLRVLKNDPWYVLKLFAEVTPGYPFEWASEEVRRVFDFAAIRRTSMSEFPSNLSARTLSLSGWIFSQKDQITQVMIRDKSGRVLGLTETFSDRPDLVRAFNLSPKQGDPLPVGYSLQADFRELNPNQAKLIFVTEKGGKFTTSLEAKIFSQNGLAYTIDGIFTTENPTGVATWIQEKLATAYPYLVSVLTFAGVISLGFLIFYHLRGRRIAGMQFYLMALIAYLILSRTALVEVLHLLAIFRPPVRYLYPVMGLNACLMVLLTYNAAKLWKRRIPRQAITPLVLKEKQAVGSSGI